LDWSRLTGIGNLRKRKELENDDRIPAEFWIAGSRQFIVKTQNVAHHI
jgi:hypothetical protein